MQEHDKLIAENINKASKCQIEDSSSDLQLQITTLPYASNPCQLLSYNQVRNYAR